MNVGFLEIRLKTGDIIPIADGITIIVGPNNVGKTRLLWDIARYNHSSQQSPDTSLIRAAVPRYRGTVEEAIEWLIQNARMADQDGSREFTFDLNHNVSESFIRAVWESDRWPIVIQPLVRMLSVDLRLENVLDAKTFSVLDGDFPGTRRLGDLQRLWASPEKVEQLNGLLQDAFGLEISVPRDLGPTIAVFMGAPEGSVVQDPEAYGTELKGTPRLVGQGHGIRAYTSLLMSIVTTTARVLLIDEPEAFLHPPQARQLGQVLERVRQQGTQIILATHSPDIVQGLVSAAGIRGDVSISRLNRHADGARVSAIPSDVVRKMALSPLLRHSSILDGLFYRGTIVCESGTDCMYYGAVLDVLVTSGKFDRRSPDIHFTHCSGANRIHEAVSALVTARIPTASIVDMDVLENHTVLKRINDAHGGLSEGTSLESDLSTVRNQVKATTRPVLRRDAEARIKETLSSNQEEHLDPSEIASIRRHIRTIGGWQEVKAKGVSAFVGTGEPYRAAVRIIEVLAAIGVFVVPTGELESFHPALDRRDKQRWLAEAIDQELYAVAGEHQRFVQTAVEYLVVPGKS